MSRLLRFCLLLLSCLALASAGRAAQDPGPTPGQIRHNITFALIWTGLIERERRHPDAAPDFGAGKLAEMNQQLAENYALADRTGRGNAIRQQARQDADRILNANPRTAYLRDFPDPWRVRADIVARADGAGDLVIAGRQEGRFALLNDVLGEMAGGSNTNDRWPADVRRQSALYQAHFFDIRDRLTPTFTDKCAIWRVWCETRYQQFGRAQHEYHRSLEPARETANLYFPENRRVAFLHETGIDGAVPQPTRAATSDIDFDTWSVYALVGFAAIGCLYLILAHKREDAPAVSGNYGTAQFAPVMLDLEDGQSLFTGVFLGASSHPQYPQSYLAPILTKPETHTLIVAPSGSGKGTRVVVPTLMLYKGSAFTYDPKGELAAMTARYRRDQLGHKVHILNPWGELSALFTTQGFAAAAFNPLDVLDHKNPNVVANATQIAAIICNRDQPNNTFWRDNASAMLTAILLWVTDTAGETRTLNRVADIVSGGEEANDLRQSLFPKMVASSSFRGAMRKLVGRFVRMPDETYYGVIGELSRCLQFVADHQIAEVTDHSTFAPADLIDGKTTVYFILPDSQVETQAVWLELMLGAVSQTYKRFKPAAQGQRGLLLLDEFAVLPRLDSIVTDIALVRGAGLDIAIVVQGLDQLRAKYHAAADTIIGNCGYKWFCNVQDLQTAEYLSKALGAMTVQTISSTINAGDGGTGRSYGETGRSLLFPDEITCLGKKVAIALIPGSRPRFLKPVEYWFLADYLKWHADRHQPRIALPDLTAVAPNPYIHNRTGDNPGAKDGTGKDPARATGMTKTDALAILGLRDGASPSQIKEAYNRLMRRVHPDVGGTDWFAQQLNLAREILLGRT